MDVNDILPGKFKNDVEKLIHLCGPRPAEPPSKCARCGDELEYVREAIMGKPNEIIGGKWITRCDRCRRTSYERSRKSLALSELLEEAGNTKAAGGDCSKWKSAVDRFFDLAIDGEPKDAVPSHRILFDLFLKVVEIEKLKSELAELKMEIRERVRDADRDC